MLGEVGRAAPGTRGGNGNLNLNLNSNLNSNSGRSMGWRGGSGCRGRCKYVHVSSVAPSMALTPLQPDPPRL